MASFTLASVADIFPVGVTVQVYAVPSPDHGVLVGGPVATGVVQSDGSVTFTGLASSTAFVAVWAEARRHFRTPEPDPAAAAAGRTVVEINGTATDVAFAAAAGRAPEDGDAAIDEDTDRFFVRSDGQWAFAALTNAVTELSYVSPTGKVITYSFAEPVQAGQYPTGEWWVCPLSEGGVVVSGIAPAYDPGEFMHGYDVNPTVLTSLEKQSLDGRAGGWQEPPVSFPYRAKTGDSIVKAYSRPTAECVDRYGHAYVMAAAVLTVLEAPPAQNTLRPPFVGSKKDVVSLGRLQMDLLPAVTSPASKITNLQARQRTQHFRCNYLGDSVRSDWVASSEAHGDSSIVTYPTSQTGINDRNTWGGDLTAMDVEVLQWLCCDGATYEEKRRVVIGLVQFGLDLFAAARTGWGGGAGFFRGGGANGAGMLMHIAFTALMLDNDEMRAWLARESEDWDAGRFWETTAFYISEKPAADGIALWGIPESTFSEEDVYWGELNNPADTGIFNSTTRDPYELIDGGPIPGDSYQSTVSNQMMALATVFALIPDYLDVWPALGDIGVAIDRYGNRWGLHGVRTLPDDAAPKDASPSDDHVTPPRLGILGPNYGVTYGPVGDGSYFTGAGRWPELDGTSPGGGNRFSQFSLDMWQAHGDPPFAEAEVPHLFEDGDYVSGDGTLANPPWLGGLHGGAASLFLCNPTGFSEEGVGTFDSGGGSVVTHGNVAADTSWMFTYKADSADALHFLMLHLRAQPGATPTSIRIGYIYNGTSFVWGANDVIAGENLAGIERTPGGDAPAPADGDRYAIRIAGDRVVLYRLLGDDDSFWLPVVEHRTTIAAPGRFGIEINGNTHRIRHLYSSVSPT